MADEIAAAASTAKRPRWPSGVLFLGILALAFLSVLVPSGPTRPPWYVAALILVAVGVGTRAVLTLARSPRGLLVVPLLLDTASIGCLVFSAGKTTGLTPMLLLPLLFSAFYGEPFESLLIIPATVLVQVVVGVANDSSFIVLARIVMLWVALLTMISIASHALRRSLQSSVTSAEEEARQSAVVAEATRAITAPLDPALVIRTAARLAAELVSPITHAKGRGDYFAVDGDVLTVVAESDETGGTAGHLVVPVAEHPLARAVLESGEPVNGQLDLDACGPGVRASLEKLGVTHGAHVPVRVGGQIVGILNASGRGEAIEANLFERLMLLASLAELALANALAHQQLEEQALTDPLTKLANRRELERAFGRLPDRLPFAYVAIDLDGFKSINDRWGHAAGDAALVAVANAIASVARRGDTVARIGGDEFAVLMLDATVDAADRLAARIHESVRDIELVSGRAHLSIGCCVAQPGGDSGLVQGTADAALYEAKRRGGASTVTRVFEAVQPALIA
ncbi:MAG: GGDEF domain-containing protein [Candidatus Dormiibacterota bacterium]